MSKIKNTAVVQTQNDSAVPDLHVHSHWNNQKIVSIVVDDKTYHVLGEDLKRAIDNCMNVGF